MSRRTNTAAGFQIDVSVRAGEKVIFQYSKDYPLTIPGDRIGDAENMGVCIADSFPLIEGKYKVTVLLRNTTGKEFSTLEREVEVPAVTGRPRLGGVVLGYKFADVQPGVHVPYQAETKKVNIDPKNTYSAADEIAFYFNILGLTNEIWKDRLRRDRRQGRQVPEAVPENPDRSAERLSFPQDRRTSPSRSGSGVPAGLLRHDAQFERRPGDGPGRTNGELHHLRPRPSVAHPMIVTKASSLVNSFIFYYMLAHQYDQVGEERESRRHVQDGAQLEPRLPSEDPRVCGAPDQGQEIRRGRGPRREAQGPTRTRLSSITCLKGRALMGLERYPGRPRQPPGGQ